jgi:hypothetical protein
MANEAKRSGITRAAQGKCFLPRAEGRGTRWRGGAALGSKFFQILIFVMRVGEKISVSHVGFAMSTVVYSKNETLGGEICEAKNEKRTLEK